MSELTMTPDNSTAVRLNNEAVLHLQNCNAVAAFELLTQASKIISSAGKNHAHVDSSTDTYRFHWVDCQDVASASSVSAPQQPANATVASVPAVTSSQDSPSTSSPASTADRESVANDSTVNMETEEQKPDNCPFRSAASDSASSTNIGNSAFLFLKGLRVTTPVTTDEELNMLCPCGYAWVVWYNLGLCCSLLGTRLGERGHALLKTAFNLYSRIQRRIDNEPASKQWAILQMAVLNNQACIYHDFAMGAAATICFERLHDTLRASPSVQGAERQSFLWNLRILGRTDVAAAA